MKLMYYISMGSNMGDRRGHLQRALEGLAARGIVVKSRSPLYETLPWGKTDQPLFLNAVIRVSWEGKPEELMRRLLAVEAENGRIRDVHWGPRTLDLDLIIGDVENDSALLRLPHPYFWDRAFVLVPLRDIAPDFSYRGERIGDRIAALHGEETVKKAGLFEEEA